MDLDNVNQIKENDPEGMYEEIIGLPFQINTAWEMRFPLLRIDDYKEIKHTLICGMGGSAIGGDLLAAYIAPQCKIPVSVNRDYDLPAWAKGQEVLVITSSHSGNTEETLANFRTAHDRGCRIISVCTGGKLAEETKSLGYPLITFEHMGQPRAAVGYSFTLLLKVFHTLGFINDPQKEIEGTITMLLAMNANLASEVPVVRNPAKRLTGQLVGKHIVVFASDFLAPVARRWKTQINELAKTLASFELLPEADHNTAAGLEFPESLSTQMAAIFLESKFNHPRNSIRSEITRKHLLVEGIFADNYHAEGENQLEQIWSTLQFGDFVAYYLAAAYGVDPTPIPGIKRIKEEMTQRSSGKQ